MKEHYEKPSMEVVELQEDVITMSPGGCPPVGVCADTPCPGVTIYPCTGGGTAPCDSISNHTF